MNICRTLFLFVLLSILTVAAVSADAADQFRWGGDIDQISITGDILFVKQAGDLTSYDLTTSLPTRLDAIGHFNAYPQDITVRGNLIALQDGYKVILVDVSDPNALTIVGTYGDDEYGASLYGYDGQRLVVYNRTLDQIELVDISQPSAPIVASILDLQPILSFNFYFSGDLLYYYGSTPRCWNCPGSIERRYIYDISDPTNPNLLYGAESDDGSSVLSSWTEIEQVGTTLYAASHWTFEAWDVSNPVQPVLTAELPLSALDLAIGDGEIFLERYGDSNIAVVDMATFTNTRSLAGTGTTNRIAFGNGRLATASTTAISILTPQGDPMASWEEPQYVDSVLTLNDLVYVTSSVGLTVADWDGTTLQTVANLPAAARATSLQTDGQHLYANHFGTLQLIKLSTPTTPELVATIDPPAGLFVVDGQRLYVVSEGSVFIYDTTDIANPLQIGSFTATMQRARINVHDGIFYVYDAFNGLSLYDVSNPAAPTLLKTYPDIDGIGRIAFRDNVAVVITESGLNTAEATLRFYDITDPLNVVEVGTPYTYFGYTHELRVEGDVVFIANGSSLTNGSWGAEIVSIADVNQPQRIASVETWGRGRDLAYANGSLFVADIMGGLVIEPLELPSADERLSVSFTPTTPTFPATGGQVEFVVEIENVSSADSWQDPITITGIDTTPFGTIAPDPAFYTNECWWWLPTLWPGQSWKCHFTIHLSAESIEPNEPLTAIVSATSEQGTQLTASDATTVMVAAGAGLGTLADWRDDPESVYGTYAQYIDGDGDGSYETYGYLIGDTNFNGRCDMFETWWTQNCIVLTADEAYHLLWSDDSSDNRYTLARTLMVSWFNVRAGNDYLCSGIDIATNLAVLWLHDHAPNGNPNLGGTSVTGAAWDERAWNESWLDWYNNKSDPCASRAAFAFQWADVPNANVVASAPADVRAEVLWLMATDGTLRSQLNGLRHSIEMVVASDGVVSVDLIAEVDAAYNALHAAGSPTLQNWLTSAYAALDLPQYVDQSAPSTWDTLNDGAQIPTAVALQSQTAHHSLPIILGVILLTMMALTLFVQRRMQ